MRDIIEVCPRSGTSQNVRVGATYPPFFFFPLFLLEFFFFLPICHLCPFFFVLSPSSVATQTRKSHSRLFSRQTHYGGSCLAFFIATRLQPLSSLVDSRRVAPTAPWVRRKISLGPGQRRQADMHATPTRATCLAKQLLREGTETRHFI